MCKKKNSYGTLSEKVNNLSDNKMCYLTIKKSLQTQPT